MLQLETIGRTVAGQHLFRGVTWTIHPGERIGMVGANGSGKSTLLRIIAGRDEPDEGKLHSRTGLRVAYLPQEVEAENSGESSVLETVLAGADDVRRLGRELTALEERMHATSTAGSSAQELALLSESYGEKRALFEWFGGDEMETRARIVLSGLGFSLQETQAPLKTFSGGWRMRALMGRMLLSGADLLLLDEPTNHLDLDALAWLETQLSQSPAAVIVVSHDRVFLDQVVTKVAHLSRERLRLWPGNYSAWVARRAAERDELASRATKLQREEARLEAFVERFRAKATKAAQAQDRARVLEGVREERAQISLERDRHFRLRLPDPPPCADPIVMLEQVEKRYGEKVVISGVNLSLRRGDRLAVMGPNGAGKTTLLRLIAGDIYPERGRRLLGTGLTLGRFAQHQLEAMDPDRTVMEESMHGAPGKKPEEVRRALGSMGIGDVHIDRRIRSLSGGERSRVALARLLLNPAALLLLDEPTNHLDLPMREALEQGIAAWPGTLLVVSHDRAFLDLVTNGTLAVDGGVVERIAPGWQAFLQWRNARNQIVDSTPDTDASSAERSRDSKRARAEAIQERSRRLKPLKQELIELEQRIHADEERLRAIDDLFADPAVAADGERMRSLVRERDQISAAMPASYSRWEALSLAIEELS